MFNRYAEREAAYSKLLKYLSFDGINSTFVLAAINAEQLSKTGKVISTCI